MTFKAEKLVKITIKEKEDFYTESEIKELRDVLLKICPIEEKIIRGSRLKASNWEKTNTGYYRTGHHLSQNVINGIIKIMSEYPNEKLSATDLRNNMSSYSVQTIYDGIQVLQQENKIETITDQGVRRYQLKQISYTPNRTAQESLQIISNIPDLTPLKEANKKDIQAMRER